MKHASVRSMVLGQTFILLAGANGQRERIIIGCPAVNDLKVSTSPGGDPLRTFYISAYRGYIELSVRDHGDLVQSELWVAGNGTANSTVSVIEVMCECQDPPLAP